MSKLGLLIIVLLALGLMSVGFNYYFQPKTTTEKSSQSDSPSDNLIGSIRPSFTLSDLDFIRHQVDEWDNQVLVVNFWASWCQPCLREIPMFSDLKKTYQTQGLQFIGIALDSRAAILNFKKENPEILLNYPVLIGEDEGIGIAQDYGNEFGILPYTVIVDREKKIHWVKYAEVSREEIEAALRPLLRNLEL